MRAGRLGWALAAAMLAMAPPARPQTPELMALHRGGVLRLVAEAAFGTDDPQINYTDAGWQIFTITQDGLVAFRKRPGAAGTELVPDLADSIPVPTNGGKTYVFHLRPGIKFSNGAVLTVEDVAASYRRMFKVLGPNVGSWYSIIVGADACLQNPAGCTLAGGVVADDAAQTVTINLTHPSGEFLQQIALPFASILPADTPPHDLGTIPPVATGPYMIRSYDPEKELWVLRNPYFRVWNEEAQPAGYVDEITYRFGVQEEAATTEVEHGQADWMYDAKPLDRLNEIGSQFANLAHITPMNGFYYLPLNTRIPPFNNLKARQAVSLAMNRRAIINLAGGPALGTPLCQILPDGIPGFSPYCPFSNPPGAVWHEADLAAAKRLVQESGTAGEKVTLITSDTELMRSIGVYVQSVLSDLGYDAALHSISENIEFSYLQNSNNKVQIGLTYWLQDYPAASDFLNVLLSCGAFHPGSDSSINMAEFCDPRLDARMQAALAMEATDPAAAVAAWQQIDHDMTDQVPLAVLYQIHNLDIVSARLRNYNFHSLYHTLFSQVWVH